MADLNQAQLNSEIEKLDHWNKDEIEKRAQWLTEQALKIWPIPQLDASVLQKYGTKVKTTYQHIQNRTTMIMHLKQQTGFTTS